MVRAALALVVLLIVGVVAFGGQRARAQANPREELYRQAILTAREVGQGFVVTAEGPLFSDVADYRRLFESRAGNVYVHLLDANEVSVQLAAQLALESIEDGIDGSGGFGEALQVDAPPTLRGALKFQFFGVLGNGVFIEGELLAFNYSIVTVVIFTVDDTPQTVDQYAQAQLRRLQSVIGTAPTQIVPTAVPRTPTGAPTIGVTATPTAQPTAAPTAAPTAVPTAAPTVAPTAAPTAAPTVAPTAAPAAAPTAASTAAATPAATAP